MKLRRLATLLINRIVVLFGICALIACFSSTALAAPTGNAFVRVIHASPDAGTVDVFVDGTALLTNFQFGTATNYVSVAAGSHQIQVAPAGKGASAAVITQTVSVSDGMAYTVAAIGTKDSGFGLQAFVDNNLLSAGTASMAKVRVYHLSPNAGPVNVATGGNTVITGLTYKNASDYLTVPAGAYTFNVTATQANATVPVSATLASGSVNSVFAVGLYNGTPALKFVAASITGIPNMPNTGNDPGATPQTNTALLWLLGITAILLLATGVTTRRLNQHK